MKVRGKIENDSDLVDHNWLYTLDYSNSSHVDYQIISTSKIFMLLYLLLACCMHQHKLKAPDPILRLSHVHAFIVLGTFSGGFSTLVLFIEPENFNTNNGALNFTRR